jgi:hypothetical protein
MKSMPKQCAPLDDVQDEVAARLAATAQPTMMSARNE